MIELLKNNRITRKVNRTILQNPLTSLPVHPVSRKMGFDRGTPIDRYYIEKFIDSHKKYVSGVVMEIAERTYTQKYDSGVTKSYVLTAEQAEGKDVIVGDLTTGEGCKDNLVDCMILTQTIPFIYDVRAAAQNIVRMLRPGGVALITVSGISMISKYDYDRWGHYWGFTEMSLKRLFSEFVSENNISIQSYGNAKAAAGFLYGLSVEEMKLEEMDEQDDLLPVTIGAVIKK